MSAALEVRDYSQFRVVPRTPVIGGWIEGCHLSELNEAGRADLRDALWTYGALFARKQNLSFDQMKQVALGFGDRLEEHTFAPTMADAGHPEVMVVRKLKTDPASFAHHTISANGIAIHHVDEGTGPLVILLHGFPYTWFAWRHQIAALAQAGYRVVAPDIRGFGESGKPAATWDYTVLHCAGDVVALLAALGERQAVLVGHDLGAWVAAAAARLRPDLFPALALVSTVVPPREAQRPSAGWAEIEAQTGGRFYHHYFQQPGLADAQFDRDPAVSLRSIYNAISGTASAAERWRLIVMPGETALDALPDPGHAPAWLGEAALAEYVRHYAAGGFTPPLAHYRCRDLNWDLTAAWAGQAIPQPSLFIGGAADPALTAMQPLYDRMEEIYPGLVRKVLLPGVGHGAPEESPARISDELIAFIRQTRLTVSQ